LRSWLTTTPDTLAGAVQTAERDWFVDVLREFALGIRSLPSEAIADKSSRQAT